jgi:hypothetical protein
VNWQDDAATDPGLSDRDRDTEIAQAMRDAADGLNDHRRIFFRGNRFTPKNGQAVA